VYQGEQKKDKKRQQSAPIYWDEKKKGLALLYITTICAYVLV
jgi:hypothetical protein